MYTQLPKMGRINLIMVSTILIMFVASAILLKMGASMAGLFGLSTTGILSGKIWTFVTYAFIPHSLMATIFDALIFWFIGSELESIWGARRYIQFIFTTILGAGILFFIIGYLFFGHSNLASFPLSGPGGLAAAMCIVYGVLFPERTMYFFFFPLQAKWFVAILVGMSLYQGIFSPGGMLAWAQLAAMLVGVLWMISVTQYKFSLNKKREANVPHLGRKRKKVNKNSHLHIVEEPSDYQDNEDDQPKPPTYH
jgi:membrane associated rhomboid family serine protease